MVKFESLTVEKLKNELGKLELPKDGTKPVLQLRLREALESQGIDLSQFEFPEDSQEDVRTSREGLSSLILLKLQDMSKEFKQQIDDCASQQRDSILELRESNDRQFQELQRSTSNQISEMESRIESLESHFDSRIKLLENNSAGVGTSSVPINNWKPARFRTPTFDGTSSFEIFKMQFETATKQNLWTDQEKVTGLIVSLSGGASEVLQTIPEQERACYDSLIGALGRKYGSDHMRQVYRLELRNRLQQTQERLQDFAATVERLAHLAYGDMPGVLLEKCKVDAFVDGIRDPDIKRAVITSSKTSFTEVVAFALTQETASLVCKPTAKIRQIEPSNEGIVDAVCEAVKSMMQPITEAATFKAKCYFCGKFGHMQKDCRILRQMQKKLTEEGKKNNEGGSSLPLN